MTIKRGLECPNCHGRVFLHFRDRRRGLPPIFPRVDIQWWEWWAPGGSTTFETFVCRSCGFTEWYACDLDGIGPDRDRGIEIVDARVPGEGQPFR